MSRRDADELTYREAWEWHFLPALVRAAKMHASLPSERPAAPAATPSAVPDVSTMSKEQAAAAFDMVCGGKIYTGERWWEEHFKRWGWQ